MASVKITLLLTCLCLAVGLPSLAGDRLYTVEGEYWGAAKDAAEAIQAYGGRVKFVFPPNLIIADVPDHLAGRLVGVGSITAVADAEVDPTDFAAYGEAFPHIAYAWNSVFVRRDRMGEDGPPPGARPLINDADVLDRMALPLKPPGSKYYDVSEFMLGTGVVAILMPESDGSIQPSTEDWTQAEKDQVAAEVVNGLNWWATKAQWRDLVFYTIFRYDLATGYEPISHPSADEYLWITDCLEAIGYTGATYPATMYTYANDLRDSVNTDWATQAYIVDSSNDADGMFTDGRFGYATLGGPKIVMTYDNDGWGIDDMDAVIAHELGHSFYALDEYFEAGRPCDAVSGYLAIQNQNSEYPNGAGGCALNALFCIMRSKSLATATACTYTKGQIGWYDDDGDQIPNILDTEPQTTLYAYSPDPCSTSTPTFTGLAEVTKLDNLNPYGKHNDITLNTISRVEYRVDSGDWAPATPTDGAWDQGNEDFHFTPSPLAVGPHLFEARAYHINSYAEVVDPTPAFDSLTIVGASGIERGVASAVLEVGSWPNPSGPAARIRYVVPGEYGKALPVVLRVYDVRGRQVALLAEGMMGPGPGKVSWDGSRGEGSMAPSGIYFVEMVAGGDRVVGKLVLTR